MCNREREVRRLLRTNAEHVRTSGGHEIWRLPSGCVFPISARGRRSHGVRTWRNALASLGRTLEREGIAGS